MLHKSERIRQGGKASSVRGLFLLLLIFLNAVVLKTAFVHHSKWYSALFITLPLLLAAILSDKQKKRIVLGHPAITVKVIDEENTKTIGKFYEQNNTDVSSEKLKYLN